MMKISFKQNPEYEYLWLPLYMLFYLDDSLENRASCKIENFCKWDFLFYSPEVRNKIVVALRWVVEHPECDLTTVLPNLPQSNEVIHQFAKMVLVRLESEGDWGYKEKELWPWLLRGWREPVISKATAKEIACRECEVHGLTLGDPIKVCWGLIYYTVVGCEGHQKESCLIVRVRKRDGKVAYVQRSMPDSR
jgi:hypothetical protein